MDALAQFLTDEQDPVAVGKILPRITELLTRDEQVEYIAVQKKMMMNFSPDAVVLTNRRFIVVYPKLLGMTFRDFPWREVLDVHMSEQMLGATIMCRTTQGAYASIDSLPKKQARRVCAMRSRWKNPPTAPAAGDRQVARGGRWRGGACAWHARRSNAIAGQRRSCVRRSGAGVEQAQATAGCGADHAGRIRRQEDRSAGALIACAVPPRIGRLHIPRPIDRSSDASAAATHRRVHRTAALSVARRSRRLLVAQRLTLDQRCVTRPKSLR